MTLNMLKVQTAPSSTDGSRAGHKSGSTTWRSRCQRLAPSSAAASSSSFGMRESAPSVTTIMNGKPSHTLVATLAVNAVQNCENHETGWMPSAVNRPFTAPNWRWNMPLQISAVM